MSKHWTTVPVAERPRTGRRHNPFEGLDYSALTSYRGELQRLRNTAQEEIGRLDVLLSLVNSSIAEVEKEPVVRISDHAVLRYLERYDNIDTCAVRRKLLDMLDDGRPEVAYKDGVIATILPPGSASAQAIADEAGE